MGYYDDYLEHHGIKGQKWGVRRFEKEGGGLTAAGQARYQTLNGKYQKLKSAKASKNAALGEYNKDFAKAYNASQRLNITKKRKADRDAKIAKAYESGEKADNAVKDYKKAKVDYKFEKKIAKNEAEKDRILEKRAENREKLQAKADKAIEKSLKNAERMRTKLKDFDKGTDFVKQGYDKYSKVLSDYRDAKISSIGDKGVKKSDNYKVAKSAYSNQVMSDMYFGKSGTKLQYMSDAARASSKAEKKAKYEKYSKAYDKWSGEQDKNDKAWNDLKANRKNMTKEAYSKKYDEWSNKQDKLDEEWNRVKSMRK